jgi:hypothetical protein
MHAPIRHSWRGRLETLAPPRGPSTKWGSEGQSDILISTHRYSAHVRIVIAGRCLFFYMKSGGLSWQEIRPYVAA